VRSLFIVVRLLLLSAFEGTPEIDLSSDGRDGSLMSGRASVKRERVRVPLKTDLRILLSRRRRARQWRSNLTRILSLQGSDPNGIRTHFESCAPLRDSVTNMREAAR
jgi:hypothetical protein